MNVINYEDVRIMTAKDRIRICLKRPSLIPAMVKGALKKKGTDEYLNGLMREATISGIEEADSD